MPQSYSDDDNIYSVDMMFAYVNVFKPEPIWAKTSDLYEALEYPSWGDLTKQTHYSPMDVINNSSKTMFKGELKRIQNANIDYPIIIHQKDDIYHIADGLHRLAKSYLNHKSAIRAYIFDQNFMNNFLIDADGDWEKVDRMEEHERIELFYKNFSK